MKSRKIIRRNACYTFKMLEAGRLYQVFKRRGLEIPAYDYWHGAKVWVRQNPEEIEGVGFVKQGITGILDETLFPIIQFDDSFGFLEIPTSSISASRCRNQSITYTKTF